MSKSKNLRGKLKYIIYINFFLFTHKVFLVVNGGEPLLQEPNDVPSYSSLPVSKDFLLGSEETWIFPSKDSYQETKRDDQKKNSS